MQYVYADDDGMYKFCDETMDDYKYPLDAMIPGFTSSNGMLPLIKSDSGRVLFNKDFKIEQVQMRAEDAAKQCMDGNKFGVYWVKQDAMNGLKKTLQDNNIYVVRNPSTGSMELSDRTGHGYNMSYDDYDSFYTSRNDQLPVMDVDGKKVLNPDFQIASIYMSNFEAALQSSDVSKFPVFTDLTAAEINADVMAKRNGLDLDVDSVVDPGVKQLINKDYKYEPTKVLFDKQSGLFERSSYLWDDTMFVDKSQTFNMVTSDFHVSPVIESDGKMIQNPDFVLVRKKMTNEEAAAFNYNTPFAVTHKDGAETTAFPIFDSFDAAVRGAVAIAKPNGVDFDTSKLHDFKRELILYDCNENTYVASNDFQPGTMMIHKDDIYTARDIYTSAGYKNPVMESDGKMVLNPDFRIVKSACSAAFAAGHNSADSVFKFYGTKEGAEHAAKSMAKEYGFDLSLDDDGRIVMPESVNESSKSKPEQTVEKEKPSESVILKGVPTSQVFKTKRDNVKMVRVADPSVPSGSFSFSATDNFIKANREGDKVVSYDVNIGKPGYYKEVSYKEGDGYTRVKLDVQDIADRFNANQQKFEKKSQKSAQNSEVKPLYLNYLDRDKVKQGNDGKSTVCVPSLKSDDGLLRIQVDNSQVLMSKSNGAVIPGKFNVRLAGDAVHQAFYKSGNEFKELAGGISARDIVADYNAAIKQRRDSMKGMESSPEDLSRSNPDVKSKDLAGEPVKRSEAAKQGDGQTPVFNNLSSAMAFDGGFGM